MSKRGRHNLVDSYTDVIIKGCRFKTNIWELHLNYSGVLQAVSIAQKQQFPLFILSHIYYIISSSLSQLLHFLLLTDLIIMWHSNHSITI